MDITEVLNIFSVFFLIGVIVSVAVSMCIVFLESTYAFVYKLMNKKSAIDVDFNKLAPMLGSIISAMVIFSLDMGILLSLELYSSSQPTNIDLIITSILGLGGAVGYHKVVEGVKQNITRKEG